MGEKVITTWTPDTCGCTLNFSWDRDSSENGRIHTYEGHNKKCHDHGNLMEQDLYNAVLEENQRKNLALKHALNFHPQKLARQMTNKDGSITNVKKDDLEYNWFYTGGAPDRILNVTFSEPLTQEEKNQIEGIFPGKLKVH